MSSPIAKDSHSVAAKKLIGLHQRASHKRRVQVLAKAIAKKIPAVQGGICLDIGCGGMEITNLLQTDFPELRVTGLDLYPESRVAERGLGWSNYRQFDGTKIPFENEAADCVVFCDVLHHMPPEVRQAMLGEAARVGKTIIIKDHFEYGWMSRTALRLMDFVGNWAYGVSVPKRYFRVSEFQFLVQSAGLNLMQLDIGLQLYDHLPIVRRVLRPKWQFIAVLTPVA